MLYPTAFSQSRAITKHDSTNFDVNLKGGLCDAVWVGGAGTLAAVFQDGSVVDFECIAGQYLPIKIKRVNSTGTDADLMVALYAV